VPLGHEFTYLVLALLQVSGRAPTVEEDVMEQIKNIDSRHHFETYVSLTCDNCPVVVQALNIMSVLNPNITHTMVDGAAFKEEILAKLGSAPDASEFENKDPFDVLVVGGGPGGASAAIYAARKGIRTGVVSERVGGQVLDTAAIENFVSIKSTKGPQLGKNLE